MSELNKERAKILGNLVKEAREHFGRTKKECAAVLDLKAATYNQVESGDYPVSPPPARSNCTLSQYSDGVFLGKRVA